MIIHDLQKEKQHINNLIGIGFKRLFNDSRFQIWDTSFRSGLELNLNIMIEALKSKKLIYDGAVMIYDDTNIENKVRIDIAYSLAPFGDENQELVVFYIS